MDKCTMYDVQCTMDEVQRIIDVNEKQVLSVFKKKGLTMKKMLNKVSLVLVLVCSLFAGVNMADAAKNNDELRIRFRENTLVVTSSQMEEARLYSMQGKLLQKEKGHFVEFELDRGTYRLYAKVKGETVSRKIELR